MKCGVVTWLVWCGEKIRKTAVQKVDWNGRGGDSDGFMCGSGTCCVWRMKLQKHCGE